MVFNWNPSLGLSLALPFVGLVDFVAYSRPRDLSNSALLTLGGGRRDQQQGAGKLKQRDSGCHVDIAGTDPPASRTSSVKWLHRNLTSLNFFLMLAILL